MKTIRYVLAILAAFILIPLGATSAQASANPQQVSYVVIPHPDDEWQTWALIENSTANYKVFIIATEGDQTGYCPKPFKGKFPDPTPIPNAKWTADCSQARINSWLDFTTRMSKTDPAVPGDWEALGKKGPFPANGTVLTRTDGGKAYAADRSVDVYVDRQGRGAAVFFDLGDGDLTEQEVVWAIKTTMNNRQALGINTTLPNYNLLGTFYNKNYSQCVVYAHPDHYSVHRAIYHHKFDVNYQSAATCRTDSDTRRTVTVTKKTTDAAWAATGHFRQSYGWLGTWALQSGTSQHGSVFMQSQSFWIRRN